ncbi:putative lactosylceramide 4-alpha-galactosyltransferase [Rosa chinensis]|uniref:Putative lactosylceramide 4-alpha-galactosyltransferase n=1 Tax=Rosa chinensis TaxID=74649 RepID=A0A2P6R984_ROSCH|nr:lactosylceramide 4-alpha-galactosyltransferase [Rosa chinensis]PRQ42984.1 putative lactosylceramide 4-alpha-galactosyltransferase [Rosa chinensis]
MKRISQKVLDYRLLRRTVESPVFTTLAFAAIFFFIYADTIVSNLPMPPAFLSSSHEHHLDDHQTTETESVRKLAIQEKIDEFANAEPLDPLIPPDNVTKEERLVWFRRKLPELEILKSNNFTQKFHSRVLEFLNNGCSSQFYMIWLSPAKSFGKREFLAMDTLFKSHPKGCLMIISKSMDSGLGYRILKPLLDREFKILAITPDLPFLVKNTPAESWLDEMKSGRRDPGHIPLSQNLSNLIRLAILYKYGGVYLDTDFIILKDFSGLRNAVGAQSIDSESKNWTRLNGAVMIFDIQHPLLRDFLYEFASTFNGNKWGHNGPYLVSRVIKKVGSTPGYNLTVLPPEAFYPVDWNRIWRLYRKPKKDLESRWVERILNELNEGETYAVHLWNKRSRALAIEEGSVMARLISEHCVICQDIYSS